MKASNLSSVGTYSFLFKGPFGFGKTLAAASFALEGPVYLSYWDKKSPIELTTFFTKKRFGALAEQILDNIEYDVYGSDNAGEYLNKIIEMQDKCKYFAIINDSITFMTSGAVNWSLNFGKSKRAMKNMKDVIPNFDEYKVETSLVSQCIDLSRNLPCHVIWTGHPLSGISVSGSGGSITVTKTNPITSYGTKVASLVPGSFTEIYHFSQRSDFGEGKTSKKYIVSTEAIGDEFAKSPLLADYIKEFEITDKLFYPVWKDLLDKSRGIVTESIVDKVITVGSNVANPFTQPNPNTTWKT